MSLSKLLPFGKPLFEEKDNTPIPFALLQITFKIPSNYINRTRFLFFKNLVVQKFDNRLSRSRNGGALARIR